MSVKGASREVKLPPQNRVTWDGDDVCGNSAATYGAQCHVPMSLK